MTLPANQPMRDLTQTPRRFLRWGCLGCLWRALAFGAGLMVVLAAAGYGYEQYASARDRQRYPPSGKLIEVDGHKLHLDCRGAGSPTVILETQATSSALDWGYVQPEIAKFTRVCAYDRAGFGWSELGPAPRTAGHAAQELHALLTAAGSLMSTMASPDESSATYTASSFSQRLRENSVSQKPTCRGLRGSAMSITTRPDMPAATKA